MSITDSLTMYVRLLYIANYLNSTRCETEIVVEEQFSSGGSSAATRIFLNAKVGGPFLLTLQLGMPPPLKGAAESFDIYMDEDDTAINVFERIHKAVSAWKVEDDAFLAAQSSKADDLGKFILGTQTDLTYKEKYETAMDIVKSQAAMLNRLKI